MILRYEHQDPQRHNLRCIEGKAGSEVCLALAIDTQDAVRLAAPGRGLSSVSREGCQALCRVREGSPGTGSWRCVSVVGGLQVEEVPLQNRLHLIAHDVMHTLREPLL